MFGGNLIEICLRIIPTVSYNNSYNEMEVLANDYIKDKKSWQ